MRRIHNIIKIIIIRIKVINRIENGRGKNINEKLKRNNNECVIITHGRNLALDTEKKFGC